MPLENLEEEGLPKNPDLRIAQLRFLLSLPEHRGDAAVRDELMAAVRDNSEARARRVSGLGLGWPAPRARGAFPDGAPDPGTRSRVPETRPGVSHPQGLSFVGVSLGTPTLLSSGSARCGPFPSESSLRGSPGALSSVPGTDQWLMTSCHWRWPWAGAGPVGELGFPAGGEVWVGSLALRSSLQHWPVLL